MTTPKSKPRKPLDPYTIAYTLKYVASELRSKADACRATSAVLAASKHVFARNASAVGHSKANVCEDMASRFEREARAARKRQ